MTFDTGSAGDRLSLIDPTLPVAVRYRELEIDTGKLGGSHSELSTHYGLAAVDTGVAHFWYNALNHSVPNREIMKRAPLIRFRIDFGEHSNLGPGKIALLEGIKAHGSLSEAARSMGLSYRRAWLLLDSLNESFKLPATINSVGGHGGGGAEVTAFGILLIERYREAERKLNVVAEECLREVRAKANTRGATSARRIPISKKIRKRT
jgi:molybdate transport system regulatory protein